MRAWPLLLLVAFPSCDSGGESTNRPEPISAREANLPTLTYDQPPARSVLEAPPAEMLDAVRQGYHPRPDRRFLLAIAQVDQLLTGAPMGEVTSTWEDGSWTIAYRGEALGALPELADLGDLMPLLQGLATKRSAGRERVSRAPPTDADELGEVRRFLAEFDAANAAEALRRIDGLWRSGRESADLLELAVRALTALQLQSYDRLDLGDALTAKALATLVVAKTLTGAPFLREEALIADELAYPAYADSVARALDPVDPVALYLASNDEVLRRQAEDDDAGPFTRYLYTLRLSTVRDPEALARWTDRYGLQPSTFGLSQLKPLLRTGRFEVDAELAALGPYIALYELWKTALPHEALREIADARIARLGTDELRAVGLLLRDGINLPQSALTQRFEQDLRLLDLRYRGPFLDADTYRAYFSAHFYSAQWKLARHILDGYGSVPLAQALAESLDGAPDGPGAELARWYRHLTDAEAGDPFVGDLLGDLRELERIGRTALQRTYDEALNQIPFGDPRRMQAAKLYAARLDSRLDNRYALATLLGRELYDLDLAERYRRSILESEREPDQTRMRLLDYVGDQAAVLTLVEDPTVAPEDRLYGWGLLRFRGGIEDARLRELARAIIRAAPDDWSLRREYVEVLGDRFELALLFKDLATLRTDAALFGDVDELAWAGPTPGFRAWAEKMEDDRLWARARAAVPTAP